MGAFSTFMTETNGSASSSNKPTTDCVCTHTRKENGNVMRRQNHETWALLCYAWEWNSLAQANHGPQTTWWWRSNLVRWPSTQWRGRRQWSLSTNPPTYIYTHTHCVNHFSPSFTSFTTNCTYHHRRATNFINLFTLLLQSNNQFKFFKKQLTIQT